MLAPPVLTASRPASRHPLFPLGDERIEIHRGGEDGPRSHSQAVEKWNLNSGPHGFFPFQTTHARNFSLLCGRHGAESLLPQRSLATWLSLSPQRSSRCRYWPIWVFIRTVPCSWTWPPPCHQEPVRRSEGEIPPASLCEVTDHGMGPRLCDSLKYGYFHSIPIAVSYVLNTQEKQEKIGLCCLVVSEQLVKAGTAGCWAASDLSQEPGPEEMTVFRGHSDPLLQDRPLPPHISRDQETLSNTWVCVGHNPTQTVNNLQTKPPGAEGLKAQIFKCVYVVSGEGQKTALAPWSWMDVSSRNWAQDVRKQQALHHLSTSPVLSSVWTSRTQTFSLWQILSQFFHFPHLDSTPHTLLAAKLFMVKAKGQKNKKAKIFNRAANIYQLGRFLPDFPRKCKQTGASTTVFSDYWTKTICHRNSFISRMIRCFPCSKVITGARACGHPKKYLRGA